MFKYAKIIDTNSKLCEVGLGSNEPHYRSIGMVKLDVEQASNGNWYLTGFTPASSEKSYQEKRRSEYPPVAEQLDMIYWDKVNWTNLWQEKIAEIKAKYPKL